MQTEWSQGDFDYNGTVTNGADLNIVLSNFNQHLSVSGAVPEPGMFGMLVFAPPLACWAGMGGGENRVETSGAAVALPAQELQSLLLDV